MDRPPLDEEQRLSALAIVATPVGAAKLLSEWLERTVTADEVAQTIAGSERLQRISSFCRSVQEPAHAATDFEARVKSMAGHRRRLGPPARK
jgi:hypothetical protein